jgi:hypothetical protein
MGQHGLPSFRPPEEEPYMLLVACIADEITIPDI